MPAILYAESSYIKCWTNSEGLTECGNRIPREYYNQRVRYIDGAGITRKVKEKEKTREELDVQLEQDKLQALEEKQIQEAKEYDEVLLKTYLTIDDLLGSLNSKLAIIESRGTVLESTLELKKRQFGNLVRQAADSERSGQQISANLAKKLDRARASLRSLQTQITEQEDKTTRIKQVFAHDVERFILTKSNRIKHSLSTPSQAKKLHAVRLNCISQKQCAQMWDKANSFIKEFSNTPMLYTTSKISVTDTPKEHHDAAMGLSMLDTDKGDNKILIFQIRCTLEREGQEYCDSDNVIALLKEFKGMAYQ
ncbi:MAG: hypothetical protein GY694_05665 [Gammaproteobacteria bacterium]|nr:hypothetical protein [Gammaproteobacteria bacterium]